MKSTKFLVWAVTFICFVCVSPVFSQTYVSGVITSDTYWDASGNPYIVTGDLEIRASSDQGVATLRIGPGVELRMTENADIILGLKSGIYPNYVYRYGRLVCEGTPESRVRIIPDNPASPGGSSSQVRGLD